MLPIQNSGDILDYDEHDMFSGAVTKIAKHPLLMHACICICEYHRCFQTNYRNRKKKMQNDIRLNKNRPEQNKTKQQKAR